MEDPVQPNADTSSMGDESSRSSSSSERTIFYSEKSEWFEAPSLDTAKKKTNESLTLLSMLQYSNVAEVNLESSILERCNLMTACENGRAKRQDVLDWIKQNFAGCAVTESSVLVVNNGEPHSPRMISKCTDSCGWPAVLVDPGVVLTCLVLKKDSNCHVLVVETKCALHDMQAAKKMMKIFLHSQSWYDFGLNINYELYDWFSWEVAGQYLCKKDPLVDFLIDANDRIVGADGLTSHGLVYNLAPSQLVCVTCNNGPFWLMTREYVDRAFRVLCFMYLPYLRKRKLILAGKLAPEDAKDYDRCSGVIDMFNHILSLATEAKHL